MKSFLNELTEAMQKLYDHGIVGVDFTLTPEKWAEYSLPSDAAGFQMDIAVEGGNMTLMLWNKARLGEDEPEESEAPPSSTKDMN